MPLLKPSKEIPTKSELIRKILMNPKTPRLNARYVLAILTSVLALAVLVTLTGAAQAQIKLQKLSTDTFTNSSTQHATEVEPDTYSFGSMLVSAFQVGRRYANGGSSDLGFATSTNGGASWKNGFLPGLTVYKGGKFDTVSDPSVVYDSHHGVWLISSLGISDAKGNTTLLASSSADGIHWNKPVIADNTSGYGDKDWITCDNTSTSKFYGHCYIEWDDAGAGDQLRMTTSIDGGQTWSKPYDVSNGFGTGGQPVVQTNGTAVVPFVGNGIQFYTSTDGGKTWGNVGTIANVNDHAIRGGLRAAFPFPSVEVAGDGTIYAAWWDCSFRPGCSSNDIVMSSSKDGKTWSKVSRIPIDPKSSTVDHFLPGLAVDQSTSGSSTHLGLTYYFYPVANCSTATCKLGVGFVSSTDAGKTWTAAKKLAGGMNVLWLPNTTLGYMVGDYISTSYMNGKAFGVFAKATKLIGSKFNEAMYTPAMGLAEIEEGNGPYFSSAGEEPLPNAKSDHGPRQFYDTEGRIPIPREKQTPPSAQK